jgi:hypothetical protein
VLFQEVQIPSPALCPLLILGGLKFTPEVGQLCPFGSIL